MNNELWFTGLKWAESECNAGNAENVKVILHCPIAPNEFERGAADYMHHRARLASLQIKKEGITFPQVA